MWPLTAVHRYVVSPNSVTFDFGEYSDTYYSVQTTKGKIILQLLTEYMDQIIHKVYVPGCYYATLFTCWFYRNSHCTSRLIQKMKGVHLLSHLQEE